MSELRRDSGIILRHIPHGETSCILTIYMREHGRMGLLVKGARSKKKNGTSVGLEPITGVQFVYYHKPTRELQLAKEWAVESAHLPLRQHFPDLTVASAVVELLLRSSAPEDRHPILFTAAGDTLSALDQKPAGRLPLLWKFELLLFAELGFGMRLKNCAETGAPLKPPFVNPLRYRFLDGAFFSHSAAPAAVDGVLSPEAFSLLASLPQASIQFASRISSARQVEHELNKFTSRYLETHLPVSGTLRSLAALSW